MDTKNFIKQYWNYVTTKNEEKLKRCFCKDACIRWYNTNEEFNVSEFMRANCDYPQSWKGRIERIEQNGSIVITAVHIFNEKMSFHAVSFFNMEGEKIKTLDEYWGDDGEAPQWRKDKHIGKPIS